MFIKFTWTLSDKGLDQQQPTYVCTRKSQTNLCYLVHKRMQPFCLALNWKAADKIKVLTTLSQS